MTHRLTILLLLAGSLGLSSEPTSAETVALWLFDEPTESAKGSLLKDSSGSGYDLELGSGRIVADGKFGHGLSCPESVPDFVARRLGVEATPLNIGNHDWTLEWWQRRDGPVAAGHVDWVYLVCNANLDPQNARSALDLQYQNEARFTGAGLWHYGAHHLGGLSFRYPTYWSVFADKYDEVPRMSFIRDVNTPFYVGEDPEFHHIAWVYDAAVRRLYYFEDGEGPFYVREGTAVAPGNQTHAVYGMIGGDGDRLTEYPKTYAEFRRLAKADLYVGGENSIGPDVNTGVGVQKIPKGYRFVPTPRDEQTVRSVIDEMRISNSVLYREPFSPPASLAAHVERPWLNLSRRRLDFVAIQGALLSKPQRLTISNTGGATLKWKARCEAPWVQLSPASGRVGSQPTELTVSVDPASLWSKLHTTRITVDTPSADSPQQLIEVRLNVATADTTVWRFDEPRDAPHRLPLEDQEVNGYDLTLGRGGKLTAGRFGNALDPRGRISGQAAIRRYIDPTHLNLGDFDWTWEAWLHAEVPMDNGAVLFMMRENASLRIHPFLAGVGARCGLEIAEGGRHVRFISEPSGIDGLLIKTDEDVMRGRAGGWHHLALSHDSSQQRLLHWINGQLQDNVQLPRPLVRLRSTGDNNLSLGKTLEGERVFNGRIDEVRISARRQYQDNFSPPASFAQGREPIEVGAGPHLFIDDHFIDESENLRRRTDQAKMPVDPPADWDDFIQQLNNLGDIHLIDLGPDAPDPRRRFLRFSYVHFQTVRGEGGIYLDSAPTRHGPWVDSAANPVINYIWATQPGYQFTAGDDWPFVYDPATRKILYLYKSYPLPGEFPNLTWYRDERFNYQNRMIGGQRRLRGLTTSFDGVRWSDFQRIFVPDDDDPGEAQFQVPYLNKRGDLYLTTFQQLNDDVDRSTGSVFYATSRDLYHWRRHRDALIPAGAAPTRGDRYVGVRTNEEIYTDDQHMYFRVGMLGSHKPPRATWQAFARLPTDRFVSHESVGSRQGRLLTPLLKLDPDVQSLQLNAAIRSGGEVRVQILDQNGHVVPGYALKDCRPITGDRIRHDVRWGTSTSLGVLAQRDRPVRFELAIRNGSVSAFYLLGPGWHGEKNYSRLAEEKRQRETSIAREWDVTSPKVLFDFVNVNLPHDLGRIQTDHLAVSPTHLRCQFAGSAPGHHWRSREIGQGLAPPAKFTITPQNESVKWRIRAAHRWLRVKPQQGTGKDGPVEVEVLARAFSNKEHDYLGRIAILVEDSEDDPIELPVHLSVKYNQLAPSQKSDSANVD